MADSYPPYFPMDSQHRGAATMITSYCLIVYTICAGVVRFCVGRKSETRFSFDDAGAIFATAFSIAAFVLYSKAVAQGLGSHQGSESSQDITQIFQIIYAAQLLGVVAMWAAKLSSVALSWRTESNSGGRSLWSNKIPLPIAGIWGFVCVLLMAFQCPQPAWKRMGLGSSVCPHGGTVQYVVAVSNMATDIWLALAPLPLIWGLKMPNDRKIRIMLLLSSRLIVPFVAVGQIITISHTQRTTDKIWARATQSVWEMLVVFFSVICAVVPRSQQFWGGLQSGGLRIMDTREYGASGGSKNKSLRGQYGDSSISRSKQRFSKNNLVRVPTTAQPQRTSGDSQRPLHAGYGKSETKVQGQSGSIGTAHDQGSSTYGSENGIMRTVEFSLHVDQPGTNKEVNAL